MKALHQNGSGSVVLCGKGCSARRFNRQIQAAPRKHVHSVIFAAGLVATLSAGWVVNSLADGNGVNWGALLGGIAYVAAVALACSISRPQPKDKAPLRPEEPENGKPL
jgi:hypothetical protein